MIDFPRATIVGRRIPKEAFYRNLQLTAALKEKFVSDVDRITVENSLTQGNLNLTADTDIKEILLLSIALKKETVDGKIIEAIARQNPHKLVFLLFYENERQLSLLHHGKLYRTPWLPESEITLTLRGQSLDAIWEGFVEQIALFGDARASDETQSVDERIARMEQIKKLEEQIRKTEAAYRKERQPKKKFELFDRLKKLKKELMIQRAL